MGGVNAMLVGMIRGAQLNLCTHASTNKQMTSSRKNSDNRLALCFGSRFKMSALSPIFHNAQQGRQTQRASLASFSKLLSSAPPPTAGFLDAVDLCLPGKPSAEVESTLEFIARAVFLRDCALLGPRLEVCGK